MLSYSAAARISTFLEDTYTVAFFANVALIILFLKRKTWRVGFASPPAAILALTDIVRQTIVNLSIHVFITRDKTASAYQDIIFCLSIILVVAVMAKTMHEPEWQAYAVWRVGDFVIMDLLLLPGFNLFNLSMACLAITMLAKTKQNVEKNILFTLVHTLAGSTFTRYILGEASRLPAIDYILLRMLIIIIIL